MLQCNIGRRARLVSASLLWLKSGDLTLCLAPEVGGSIARFDHIIAGVRSQVMRGAQGEPASVLACANFPLVPYSNRLRGGAFKFRGRTISIAPNMPGDPSPLHGHGWLGRWTVEHASRASAELSFVHQACDWPWTYEARQIFALDARGLDLSLTCRNLSQEAMPCGLGQHPYFPCTQATRLSTQVSHAWTVDEAVLPVELVSAQGRYDLSDRLICGQDLDNGFENWGGEARISTPGSPFTVSMRSANAGRFQVYSPVTGGLVVAEPVQAANAALNAAEPEWERLGLSVLEPGEEARLDTRFDVIMEPLR